MTKRRPAERGDRAEVPGLPAERSGGHASTGSRQQPSSSADGGSRWTLIAAISLVTLLVLLDDTAVSVALPTMQRELGFGYEAQEWVVISYTLALAVFTLLAGHLADRIGASRIFLVGLAVFIAGSLLTGLTTSVSLLIAFRTVQGTGAAMVAPAALALIAGAFSDRRRGTALGIWAGISGSALGIGPIVGAYVTETLGWSWIFLLNVPLGAVAWLVAWRVLPATGVRRPQGRPDLIGAALSAVALLGLLLGLSRGNDWGWTSPATLGLLALVPLGLALFVVHERRTSHPLVDLRLFANRVFTGATVVTLFSTAVMCSLFFFLALYLQTVVGLTPLASGAALLPLTLTIVLVAPIAGRLSDRFGTRALVVGGTALLGVGLLGMSGLRSSSDLVGLMLWLALAGFGIALARTPTTSAALGSAGEGAYGMASSVVNTAQAAGLALGISIMSVILTAVGPGAAFSAGSAEAHHEAFIAGFSTGLLVNATIALATALLAFLMFADPTRRMRTPTRVGRGGAGRLTGPGSGA
ncbi:MULTISPECIES: DHA2 family efflux MFS transporter permease subunit [Bacteria]